jgi:dTMP kinase
MYVVFEGIVGTGKTTQSKRLVKLLQSRYPEREVFWTREPGGDSVAEAIRDIAQAQSFDVSMDPVTEVYLYAAARAQLLRTIVQPALNRGAIVVSDRSFISSVAFQGFGRKLGLDTVLKINDIAIRDCRPDLVLFLDAPLEVALSRIHDQTGDKFERLGEEFFAKVREGYLAMANQPITREAWVTINANQSLETVFEEVVTMVNSRLD